MPEYADDGASDGTLALNGIRIRFASMVQAFVRHRRVLLPAVMLITVFTTHLAFQLGPKLDVKEFSASDSDLVVGLDKLEQHITPAFSGEPAVIYIEGDLTFSESLDAIQEMLGRLGDSDSLARTRDGELSVFNRTVLDLLGRVTEGEYGRLQVEAVKRVVISDIDEDGISDTDE